MGQAINPDLLDTIKLYQPRLAILFGSQARGNADSASDIDLILVKDTPDNFFDRLKKLALMLPNNAPRVDALIYTPAEFDKMKEQEIPLIRQAIEQGEIIYEAPN